MIQWHDTHQDNALTDVQRDGQERRFRTLTTTPIAFHSPAVLARRAQIARDIEERETFHAADTFWGLL